jgi:hypothetical protein
MKNAYEIRGDVTAIFLHRRDGIILECLIDTKDLHRVAGEFASLYLDHGYVVGHPSHDYRRKKYLHRVVMGNPPSDVDHRFHDKLDNRKELLRLVTQSQNLLNRCGATTLSTSGRRGVHFHRASGRWCVRITVDGRSFSFGMFGRPEEAGPVAEQRYAELEANEYVVPVGWKTGHKPGRSGHLGVGFCPLHRKWRAKVRRTHIGYFASAQSAGAAVADFLRRTT